MPEQLKPSTETSMPDSETSHGLSALTEMAGKFDPEAAAQRVEAARQTNASITPETITDTTPETFNSTVPETANATPEIINFEPSSEPLNLATSSEQPDLDAPKFTILTTFEQERKEPTPEEAADEYLSLLDELSQDFTNPYYSDERQGQHHYAPNITTDLGRKYSKNPHYRWRGYAGTEAGDTDGTMLRIASADSILANEILWREEGAKIGEQLEQTKSELTTLDENYSKKSAFAKFFGKRKYKKQRAELENTLSSLSRPTTSYDKNIAQELAISYNGQGNYAGDPRTAAEQNESRNRQFFGFDDPERAAKVERAIALRQKYETIWKNQQPSTPEKPSLAEQPSQELSPSEHPSSEPSEFKVPSQEADEPPLAA